MEYTGSAAGERTPMSTSRDSEGTGEAFLCYDDNAGRPLQLSLSVDTPLVVIGRAEEADIALTWDESVSTLHAVVRWMGAHWTVEDNGLSRNGTFVNGTRLCGSRRLHSGDFIAIGETTFTVCGLGGVGQRTTKRAESHTATSRPPMWNATNAQMNVLRALCRPYLDNAPYAVPASTKRIAEELNLSEATVKSHLRELFRRFDVGDAPPSQKRTRLAQRALHYGLVADFDGMNDGLTD